MTLLSWVVVRAFAGCALRWARSWVSLRRVELKARSWLHIRISSSRMSKRPLPMQLGGPKRSIFR